jgi:uncharacterized protein (TIGR00369 family)
MTVSTATEPTDPASILERIQQINGLAAFNRWAGISVLRASEGEVEIELPWKGELGQYSGFLHAGLIGALIDTVCGFAAATVATRVLASHFSVNCLAPAVGERFTARGRVTRAGKRQIFTAAELFAHQGAQQKLVANGETLLMRAVE